MADTTSSQPTSSTEDTLPVEEQKTHMGKKILAQALLIGAAVKSAFSYLKDPKNKEAALEQTEELEEKVQEKTAKVTHVAEDVKKKAVELKAKATKAVAAAKGGKKTVKEAAVVAGKSVQTKVSEQGALGKTTVKKSAKIRSTDQKNTAIKSSNAETVLMKKEASVKKVALKVDKKSTVVKKAK